MPHSLQSQTSMTIQHDQAISRREFLAASTGLLLATNLAAKSNNPVPVEPIIDVHQHTNYMDRTDEQLIAHQKALGATMTILLPAGRLYGLDAKCGGNDTVISLAKRHPDSFKYFANEITDDPDAVKVVKWHLRRGPLASANRNSGSPVIPLSLSGWRGWRKNSTCPC